MVTTSLENPHDVDTSSRILFWMCSCVLVTLNIIYYTHWHRYLWHRTYLFFVAVSCVSLSPAVAIYATMLRLPHPSLSRPVQMLWSLNERGTACIDIAWLLTLLLTSLAWLICRSIARAIYSIHSKGEESNKMTNIRKTRRTFRSLIHGSFPTLGSTRKGDVDDQFGCSVKDNYEEFIQKLEDFRRLNTKWTLPEEFLELLFIESLDKAAFAERIYEKYAVGGQGSGPRISIAKIAELADLDEKTPPCWRPHTPGYLPWLWKHSADCASCIAFPVLAAGLWLQAAFFGIELPFGKAFPPQLHL